MLYCSLLTRGACMRLHFKANFGTRLECRSGCKSVDVETRPTCRCAPHRPNAQPRTSVHIVPDFNPSNVGNFVMILQFEQVVSSTFPQNVGFFVMKNLDGYLDGWVLGWMGLGMDKLLAWGTTTYAQDAPNIGLLLEPNVKHDVALHFCLFDSVTSFAGNN